MAVFRAPLSFTKSVLSFGLLWRLPRKSKSGAAFAIISHPEAPGKTTLTEKLLQYPQRGAVGRLGHGPQKSTRRHFGFGWNWSASARHFDARSTVLQFDYDGYRVDLLDTPGHKDFSEDTYRVLTAVDAVVMVIDAGNRIEAQTLKLLEVFRKFTRGFTPS